MNDQKNVEGIVTINLPCQFGYLRIARQSVMDFSMRAGMSEYKSSQLEMAVDEACANIIEHSYGGEVDFGPNGESHPGLQMNLTHRRDRDNGQQVVVEICDFGNGFDFDASKTVDPKEYMDSKRERGLGMYIIRNFVDEMDYRRSEDGSGNQLRLVKQI